MDNVNLWLVLQGLAESYEADGQVDRAVETYRRFIELARDADPELQHFV